MYVLVIGFGEWHRVELTLHFRFDRDPAASLLRAGRSDFLVDPARQGVLPKLQIRLPKILS